MELKLDRKYQINLIDGLKNGINFNVLVVFMIKISLINNQKIYQLLAVWIKTFW